MPISEDHLSHGKSRHMGVKPIVNRLDAMHRIRLSGKTCVLICVRKRQEHGTSQCRLKAESSMYNCKHPLATCYGDRACVCMGTKCRNFNGCLFLFCFLHQMPGLCISSQIFLLVCLAYIPLKLHSVKTTLALGYGKPSA